MLLQAIPLCSCAWGSGNESAATFALIFVVVDRLDSEVAAMDSDGRCTVVACKDASLRLLSSLDDGGFVQASGPCSCLLTHEFIQQFRPSLLRPVQERMEVPRRNVCTIFPGISNPRLVVKLYGIWCSFFAQISSGPLLAM